MILSFIVIFKTSLKIKMSKIQQRESTDVNISPIDLDFKSIRSSSYASTVVTEKYLENNFTILKAKSDNVLKSTQNYLVKYYKPSRNCN